MSGNVLRLLFILWRGSHYNRLITITSTSAGTQYFAAVVVLNTYAVHDLNGLDVYTLHTVHEQDSVVVRHKRKN